MVAVTQTQATASHLAVTDTRASQDWVSRELDQEVSRARSAHSAPTAEALLAACERM